MKKILLFSVALFTMSASYAGDALTATLQQGNNMKAFYGVDAFKEAYAAASNGAVITLSAGTFNTVDSVAKSVSIVGSYGFSNNSSIDRTIMSSMRISANNVKVEGIYFTNVYIGSVSNCHIKRCNIGDNLRSTATHTNTLIDQCVVYYADYAIGNGINYTIQNSTIARFYAMNTTDNIAHITNCVVWSWYSQSNNSYKQPYAIYLNNVLGGFNGSSNASITNSTYSEFYYNLFINIYSSSTAITFSATFPNGCVNKGNVSGKNWSDYYSDYIWKYPAANMKSGATMLGMDGTTVGLWGGSGFSYSPAIPRVTSSTIDNATDADGKINVKISAKAEP